MQRQLVLAKEHLLHERFTPELKSRTSTLTTRRNGQLLSSPPRCSTSRAAPAHTDHGRYSGASTDVSCGSDESDPRRARPHARCRRSCASSTSRVIAGRKGTNKRCNQKLTAHAALPPGRQCAVRVTVATPSRRPSMRRPRRRASHGSVKHARLVEPVAGHGGWRRCPNGVSKDRIANRRHGPAASALPLRPLTRVSCRRRSRISHDGGLRTSLHDFCS